jgi:hypothetical protein
MTDGRTRPRPKARDTESFEARVIRLCDELRLAIEWDRPSILLAVCQSEPVRLNAQTALVQLLELVYIAVELFEVNAEENLDIPMRLCEKQDSAQKVFFVQGLARGGEEALRALNFRREYFVEKHIRTVFWLTEAEEQAIAEHAPDFWSFRHRVVYFKEDEASQPSGDTHEPSSE